jgi:hypothetical protein
MGGSDRGIRYRIVRTWERVGSGYFLPAVTSKEVDEKQLVTLLKLTMSRPDFNFPFFSFRNGTQYELVMWLCLMWRNLNGKKLTSQPPSPLGRWPATKTLFLFLGFYFAQLCGSVCCGRLRVPLPATSAWIRTSDLLREPVGGQATDSAPPPLTAALSRRRRFGDEKEPRT